jgi:rubrerythrin
MMNDAIKQKLLSEFETMRLIEKDAYEFYLKASADPNVADPAIRKSFSGIAEDERYHVELVERIMNILRNCM